MSLKVVNGRKVLSMIRWKHVKGISMYGETSSQNRYSNSAAMEKIDRAGGDPVGARGSGDVE